MAKKDHASEWPHEAPFSESNLPDPPLESAEVADRKQILVSDGINEEEAKLLAELGYVKTSFPYEGPGGIILGPYVIANADKTKINWEGVGVFVLQRPDIDGQPAIRDYVVGEEVQVFRKGGWVEGTISRSESQKSRMVVTTREGEEVTVRSQSQMRRVL